MRASSTRIFLGCVAGALAMLMFHQMTQQIFFWSGWAPHPAFRVAHVPPFNAPLVVSIDSKGNLRFGPSAQPVTVDDLKKELLAAVAKTPDVRVAISNGFGFGGHNAVVVLGRYEE